MCPTFHVTPEHEARELLNIALLLERCLALPDITAEERAAWEIDLDQTRRRLEDRLAKLKPAGTSDQDDRIRKALEDNLQTSRDRLINLQRARDNFDMVKLEIDRLENKIQSLSELAVNRQEPDYISGQVDQVASSMMETEKTMNELRFVTGLDTADEAPSLLQSEISQPTRAKQLN